MNAEPAPVAGTSPNGAPYQEPLSFDWNGGALLVATPADSPTGRNLAATRTTPPALGHTRDVAVLAGTVEIVEIDALPPQELRARELMRDGRCLVSHSPDT
ncbi:hypothetical protein BIV25_07450 [Streptomyces sp. MUSC 14]|uniref:hypothetical protein n=1 Tax=Streptomyces sp. MUSC 14 TaxID=1354889 RepID=UPI0008F5C4E1|nr:hypothetical protein [Streptomyces sp. MUSC 14]OIK00939.1 hypothetical protein BIV25_07450 [Streptomyces sp. MUSC 14]